MFDHYEYLHMKVLINFMGNRKKQKKVTLLGSFMKNIAGRKVS